MHSDKGINEINNLAEQAYWDSSYASHEFGIVPESDEIRQWLEKFIPENNSGSCLEIGAFPGRYLAIFGELGYELNGIDLTPRIKSDLPSWLKSRGYRTGIFEQVDVFKFKANRKFNVVCSFGFIEHFKNWEEVFHAHAQLVEDLGYLVIETPNFRGPVQKIIHSLLDRKNLSRHYLPAMNLFKWKQIAEKEGFEVLYCNYVGEFDFWIDESPKSFIGKLLFRLLTKSKKYISILSGKLSSSSPYMGIIARKNK